MLFTSIYGIVDGLCVSNFVGKTAFAAVNLIMPLPQLLGTIGFMLGTGGSAIVGLSLIHISYQKVYTSILRRNIVNCF